MESSATYPHFTSHAPNTLASEIHHGLQQSRQLLEEQIALRSSTPFERPYFAADFDIIHKFVERKTAPTNATDTAAAAAGLLVESDQVRFTLPPGAVWELIRYCAALVPDLAIAQTADDLIAIAARETDGPTAIDLDLNLRVRQRLTTGLRTIEEHTQIVRRIGVLLQSTNLVSLEAVGLFPPDEEDFSFLIDTLARIRPHADRRNRCDAVNLASILLARKKHLHLPLISNTRSVHETWNRIPRRTPEEDCLGTLWPIAFLHHLALATTASADLLHMKQELDLFIEHFAHHQWPSPDKLDAVPLRDVIAHAHILKQLTRVTERLQPLWEFQRKYDNGPATRHIDGLIADVFAARDELTTGLVSVFVQLQAVFGYLAAAEHPLLPKDAFTILRTPTEAQGLVQNLIIMHNGATMNHYTVTQTGNNNTAIIDSFKITINGIANDIGGETAQHLNDMTNAVTAAPIDDGQKKDILGGMTTAATNVREHGKLTGTAKMLWTGLKESLSLIPPALKAWEALHKLWT